MATGHSVIITKASHDLLKAHAQGTMKPCEQTSDGMYVAWFDDEVYAHLTAISDNIDEAIRMVCSKQFGRA